MPKALLQIICITLSILGAAHSQAGVKNPDTFVLATYGTLRTLDPAVCYDSTGSQRIWNIYENRYSSGTFIRN